MKNQSMEIPAYLKPQWQAASEEVRMASEELQKASARYYEAVRARIALTGAINDAQLQRAAP